MTTTEKLNAIKSKCEELLALAGKRTSGNWANDWDRVRNNECLTVCLSPTEDCFESQWKKDKTYIAACAGSAEAGWRATIAAVDLLSVTRHHPNCITTHAYFGAEKRAEQARIGCDCFRKAHESKILAAWDGQL